MTAKSDAITDLKSAEQYLFSHIPRAKDFGDKNVQFLSRTERLLELLGNPHHGCRVVHVAGTSGKGSTVFLTATALTACGQKTGAFFSPHLERITERVTIDGEEVSEKSFVAHVQAVREAAEKMNGETCGAPTYFEMLVATAFLCFSEHNVDYAVIETGLGGLCDATNVVSSPDKVCVITDIGKDHMHILGDTLEKIALQKAGIVHKDNAVFSFVSDSDAQSIIAEYIVKQKAHLEKHFTENDLNNITVTENGTILSFENEILKSQSKNAKEFNIGLIGAHQARNVVLALSAAHHLSERDGFTWQEEDVRKELAAAEFPGRMSVRHVKNKTVILDGAHNEQKIRSLMHTVSELYPGKKVHVVFACKEQKDHHAMLAVIAEHTEHITLTEFGAGAQDYISHSTPAEKLAETLANKNDHTVDCVRQPKNALKRALDGENDVIVVTGSLHLVAKTMRDL